MFLTCLSGVENVSLFDFLTYKLSLCWVEFSSGNGFAATDILVGICVKNKKEPWPGASDG